MLVEHIVPEESHCFCGHALVLSSDLPTINQRLEIPPVKVHVTERMVHKKYCSKCGKVYKSNYSRDLLGKNAKGIISVLGGFFNNSKREIQSILQQIFNLDISLGLISKTEGRVSDAIEGEYDAIRDELLSSDTLNL